MVRQSLVVAFGIIIIAIFSTIGVIMYPLLFFTPPNWEVALSRLLMSLLPLLLLIGILVYLWVNIEKLDREKDDKTITKFKEAIREVLKESQEELIKKEVTPSKSEPQPTITKKHEN